MRAMNQIQITTFNLQVTSRETESNQEKGGTDRRREQSPIIRHPDHPTVMEGFGSDTNPKESIKFQPTRGYYKFTHAPYLLSGSGA